MSGVHVGRMLDTHPSIHTGTFFFFSFHILSLQSLFIFALALSRYPLSHTRILFIEFLFVRYTCFHFLALFQPTTTYLSIYIYHQTCRRQGRSAYFPFKRWNAKWIRWDTDRYGGAGGTIVSVLVLFYGFFWRTM